MLLAAAAVAVYRKIVTRIIGGVIRNDLFEKPGSRSVFFVVYIYPADSSFLVVALTEGPESTGYCTVPLFRRCALPAVFGEKLSFLCGAGCFNSAMDFVPLCRRIVSDKVLFVLVVARNC